MCEKKRLTIVVVGAGPSGLCCAKNALDYGFHVTIYEQNSTVGGTWIYTDDKNDAFALPVHSSMYKGVVTNVPVECMGFVNYPFPKKQHSFVHHEEVLDFFQTYASDFNLYRVIQFQTQVVNVRPVENGRWEVLSKKLRTNTYETKQFDAIFVCNGHYSRPFIPSIEGLNEFRGHKMHSHDYRIPDPYENETVLIVGAGPSGKDIMLEIAQTANRVILSHHRDLKRFIFPSNVRQVGDVKRFNADSVQFVDGEEESITSILFCTGYVYSFPFLSVDCGLSVSDQFLVYPLYKHLININRRTMAIIGLQICAYTLMYDLQARLCLKYWSGEVPMPSKIQMLEEYRSECQRRKKKNGNIRKSHLLDDDQTEYLRELSDLGCMIKIPEVLFRIYNDCSDLRVQYPNTYREFNYRIIDNDTYERHHVPQN